MDLVHFDVEGYRALADVKNIPVGKPAILTGHNDAGKSASLRALGFLLGEGLIGEHDYTRFDVTEGNSDEDLDAEATMVARGLNGNDALPMGPVPRVAVTGTFQLRDSEVASLELAKRLRLRRSVERGCAPRYELEGEFPLEERLRGFENLSLTELKKRCHELGIAPTGPANTKTSFLEPLRAAATAAKKSTDWAECPKTVLERLPRFVLFSSTAEPDPAADVRTALAASFKVHMAEPSVRDSIATIESNLNAMLAKEIEDLKEHVLTSVDDLTSLEIAPSVSLTESFKNVDFSAGREGNATVSLAQSGAGRKRLVTLAVWEWSSKILGGSDPDDPGVVIAYDEPDTHLDYGRQRRLMDLFHLQCSRENVRMVVATHSLNLIDRVDISDVAHFGLEAGLTRVDRLIGTEDRDIATYLSDVSSAMGLRNSVLLHEQCFVVVEGATEQQCFPVLFRLVVGLPLQSVGLVLMAADGNEGAIKVAGHLKKLGRTVHLVIDADTKAQDSTKRMFRPNMLRRVGIDPLVDVTYLGKLELEDLFSDATWASVANSVWRRVDGKDWANSDFSVHREGVKFSSDVLLMLGNGSENGPRTKPAMMNEIVKHLANASDVPADLADAMRMLSALTRES
ncbi:AAA family ATPase [Demequina aurantiaca]|uniref:AAA family ATPase n=1 Tax=Demequina aurantiaca TaxID=676200 RepID=UPI000782AE6A|nr:AAA family ATPase [Demequina aurantiaca]